MHQVLNRSTLQKKKNLPIFIKVKCKTNKLLMLGSIFVELHLHSFDPFSFVPNFSALFLLAKLKISPPPDTHRHMCDLNQVLEMIAIKILPFLKHRPPDIEMLQLLTDTLRKGDILTNMEKFNHAEILTH